MNNYYQIILDKVLDPLSIELVLYSKTNYFPQLKIRNSIDLKYFNDNAIHNLKRYNIINISREDFYQMYNNYCANKLREESKLLLENKNSLFVNFIVKDNNECEGRIFEQNKDSESNNLTNEEITLLKEINN